MLGDEDTASGVGVVELDFSKNNLRYVHLYTVR